MKQLDIEEKQEAKEKVAQRVQDKMELKMKSGCKLEFDSIDDINEVVTLPAVTEPKNGTSSNVSRKTK